MAYRKKLLFAMRIVVFWGIFSVALFAMSRFFAKHPDYKAYQMIGGFYEEEEDSLDAVYLGSSNCYAFWNPVFAWHEYGLAVYMYANPNQSFYATEYLIREARKTQPNALYIVNVNAVGEDDLTASDTHSLLDYMPESEEKTALIDCFSDLLGYSWLDRLEFRYPWIRNRELWYERLEKGPLPPLNGYKGTSDYNNYLYGRAAITYGYFRSHVKRPVPDALVKATHSLLDYCEKENVKVLFVSAPRAEETLTGLGRIVTICQIIRSRGHDMLYLPDRLEEMGEDLTQDYYNNKHTNVHGSLKFSGYLSRYLMDHYDFSDKRGNEAYAGWDRAWDKYYEIIKPAILDIELDVRHRTWALAKPDELTVAAKDGDGKITEVSWKSVKDASGYAVYRKNGESGVWTRLADTQQTHYEDAECPPDGNCRYTVVPWREENGEVYYGNFDYSGVKAA